MKYTNPQIERYAVHNLSPQDRLKFIVQSIAITNLKSVRETIDYLGTKKSEINHHFDELLDKFLHFDREQAPQKIEEMKALSPLSNIDEKLLVALDNEKVCSHVLAKAKSKMPEGTSTKTLSCNITLDELKTNWGSSKKLFIIVDAHINLLKHKHGENKISTSTSRDDMKKAPVCTIHFDEAIIEDVEEALFNICQDTMNNFRNYVRTSTDISMTESKAAFSNDTVFKLLDKDGENMFGKLGNDELAGKSIHEIKASMYADKLVPQRERLIDFLELLPHYVPSEQHPIKDEIDAYYKDYYGGTIEGVYYEAESAAFTILEPVTKDELETIYEHEYRKAQSIINKLEIDAHHDIDLENDSIAPSV